MRGPASPQKSPAGHRFYHDVSLRGPTPDRLLYAPQDPSGPNPAVADRLATVAAAHAEAFFAREARTFAYAQSFAWLAPLAHREDGRHVARALWEAWLRRHGRYAPRSWAPPLAAARTEAMLGGASLLLDGRDAPQREAVFGTLIRQTRHLARALKGKPADEQRLPTLIGAALGALCLPFASDQERAIKPLLAASLSAMAGGALPSGLRDPAEALRLGISLGMLQATYRARGLTPPADLPAALMVVRLLVGGLRLPDGRFCVLPGMAEGDAASIAALDPPLRPEADDLLSHYGYAATRRGGMVLHADLGRLGGGPGAFCLTYETQRLVTATGAPASPLRLLDPKLAEWADALSGPAAAATLDAEGYGPASLEREDSRAGTLLGLSRSSKAGRHQRRLFLDADGGALRGEDRAAAPGAVYRFPLHPSVEARAQTDGRVTLVAPGGRSWRFEAAAAVTAEDGVYSGGGVPMDCRQVVVRAEREGVRWAIRRV